MPTCCFFEKEFPELSDTIGALRIQDQDFLTKLNLYNEIRQEIEHIGEDNPLRINEFESQNEGLLNIQESLIHRIAVHMQLNKR